MTTLSVGDTAPGFTLPNADGDLVSLSQFTDSHVILYFYPAAMTPGCTIEARDFGAALSELHAQGYHVIGVSPDTTDKLVKFREQESISFRLLSDLDKQVMKAYGAFGIKTLYGKRMEGVIRSTFVIDVDADGDATVRLAEYNIRATGYVDRLRRELGV